jgi:hypothetical protein
MFIGLSFQVRVCRFRFGLRRDTSLAAAPGIALSQGHQGRLKSRHLQALVFESLAMADPVARMSGGTFAP